MSLESALETLKNLHTNMTAHREAAAKHQDNHEFDSALEQLELVTKLYESQMQQVHREYPQGHADIKNAKKPLRALFKIITALQRQYADEKNVYDEEQEQKRLAEQEPQPSLVDAHEEQMSPRLHDLIAEPHGVPVDEQESGRLAGAEQEPQPSFVDDTEEDMPHLLHVLIAEPQEGLVDEQESARQAPRLVDDPQEVMPVRLHDLTAEQQEGLVVEQEQRGLAGQASDPQTLEGNNNDQELARVIITPIDITQSQHRVTALHNLDSLGQIAATYPLPYSLLEEDDFLNAPDTHSDQIMSHYHPLSSDSDVQPRQPSPRLSATQAPLLPTVTAGHVTHPEEDNREDPYELQRFSKLPGLSTHLQYQIGLFIEQFIKATVEIKNLEPTKEHEMLNISNKTYQLIVQEGIVHNTDTDDLYHSPHSPRQRQEYLELAQTVQGKPSPAMQILGGIMLSISALVALAALTAGAVTAVTSAAVSLPLMAAGIGFFNLGRPRGLSKAMIGIEAAVVEEETDDPQFDQAYQMV